VEGSTVWDETESDETPGETANAGD
jgi:hypothetical protein